MTRSELILHISEKYTDLSVETIEQCVKNIFEYLIDGFKKNHRAEIRNFGSFEVRNRTSKTLRNPLTRETFVASDRRAVHFKPGKHLKNNINSMASEYPIEE